MTIVGYSTSSEKKTNACVLIFRESMHFMENLQDYCAQKCYDNRSVTLSIQHRNFVAFLKMDTCTKVLCFKDSFKEGRMNYCAFCKLISEACW